MCAFPPPLYVNYSHYILIPVMALNSSTETEDTGSSCYGIPSHQHIQIWSGITGMISGVPQRDIVALHVRCVSSYHHVLIQDMLMGQIQVSNLVIFSYSLSDWALDCRGSDVAPCEYPLKTHLFPVTSSVTFIDIPVGTGPPKTRCIFLAAAMSLVSISQATHPTQQPDKFFPFPQVSDQLHRV